MQQTSPRSDSLGARLISAIAGIPLLLLFILASPVATLALAAGVVVLALLEFYRLVGLRGGWRLRLPSLLVGLGFIAAGWYGQALPLGALALLSPLVLLAGHRVRASWPRAGLLAMGGPLYLGTTLAHGVLLRRLDQGAAVLLLAVLSTFAVDTAAYFAGRAFGRHKLAPRISPGKTWEGAVGGLAAGVVTPVALAALFGLPLALWQAALIGGVLGIVGQGGDLLESALKRAHQVKDTGNVIPGHGGIMDRLDSIVYNLVVVYHLYMWGTM
ncbi:MAG: phosphatidate cytidylyltransferase [Chloroflexi bacterium]|nr:phosphatidate cytidylyltransferase [Chloroflexota bacterium]